MTAPLPHIVIRASAGTGKTYQLANRYLRLLAADVPPESILATTFTRKAAGEILDRLLQTLAVAARDPKKRRELATALNEDQLSVARCEELLSRLTSRLHRLQVGTLDSFFAKLAGCFSLELGLPPDWRILDHVEEVRLRNEAIEALLEAEADDALVRLLRLLTKGTTSRSISDLIATTVKNCHEVSLETPVSAWQRIPQPNPPTDAELRESKRALLKLCSSAISTFQKPIAADIELAEQEQWEEMLKGGILKKLVAGETKYNKQELDAATLAVYRPLLDRIRRLVLNRLSHQTQATRMLLDKYDRALRELQRHQGGCTFTDVARALATHRDQQPSDRSAFDRLTFRFDSQVSHVLLDEFQDTSPLQWRVLQPFAEQVTGTVPARGSRTSQKSPTSKLDAPSVGSFFCVGDVKQAIYGWRGGDARIFDTLQRQLPSLDSQELATSYRSAQPIIDTVNRVFENLHQHSNLEGLADAVRSWQANFPKHTTAKGKLRGYVEFRSGPKKADGESQEDVTLQAAADLIAKLAGDHPNRTIGVLTRSNDAVARLIFELHLRQVEASEEGGHPLTDSVAVRVLCSLLRLADHPGDTLARFHVAMSPLGPELHFTDFRDDARAARLAFELRQRLLVQGYGPSLAAWAERLAEHGTPRDCVRLKQMVRLADAFQHAATLRPTDFVEFLSGERVADPSADRIRVMTLHQAKGLEFDIVVLPELDEPVPGQTPALVAGNVDPTQPPDAVCLYRNEHIQQLLPPELQSLFKQDREQRVHESLCVLYVALTRAVHAMYLLIAPHAKEPTKTFAGLLRAALIGNAPVEPNSLLYQTGHPDWDVSDKTGTPGQPVSSEPASGKSAQLPTRIRFAPAATTPERGWQRRSPSTHEVRELAELLRPRATSSLERGSLIHKWFEQIEWLDQGVPSNAHLLAAARALPPKTLRPSDLLPDFLAMLQQPAIAAALRRDQSPHRSLTPRVLREHPFACRVEQTLINGVFDRLVLWSRGDRLEHAEIFDFKTDEIADDAELAAATENYRTQLDLYRRAVTQIFGLPTDNISARLLFVNPGRVIDV